MTSGSELSYEWYSGSTPDDTATTHLFTRIYTLADNYNITAVVSNPLGVDSNFFVLQVQDKVASKIYQTFSLFLVLFPLHPALSLFH